MIESFLLRITCLPTFCRSLYFLIRSMSYCIY
nr:MAG TPA: hypothetical protein [Caudoviricetes sp.]